MVGIVLGCECDQLREGGCGWVVVIGRREIEVWADEGREWGHDRWVMHKDSND